ncbi:farnesol dehydrogenase-like [Arctopsyche grandis]|uniref:farnesol dehydrogenase-like n=1 Tax=Arctopsyche grandis TaxID=121162 RepID=UPI00406D86E9
MERWVGKIAVVTGASEGIGAAICKTLAEKGLIVVGLARRSEKIKELAVTTNGKLHAVKCDLVVEDEIVKAFRYIEESFGGVDLLVNNAGVLSMSGLVEGSTKEWAQTLNTNVLALSICTKEALKSMRKRGDDGHVIHINSVAGHRILNSIDKLGMYAATKHGVTVLTEYLRAELRNKNSKIKITSLSPGVVHTNMAINGLKSILNIDLPSVDQTIPDKYLAAQSLADMVIMIITANPNIEIQELTLESIGKLDYMQ